MLGAFGLTEPDAGSDARGIQTRAEQRDGGWLINGRKTFISNAGTDMSFGVTLLARAESAEGQEPRFATLVVESGATARDMLRLIDLIRTRVQDRFHLELELAISVW